MRLPKEIPPLAIRGANDEGGIKAPAGIEPASGGFADLCLTTWLRRREEAKLGRARGLGKSVRQRHFPDWSSQDGD